MTHDAIWRDISQELYPPKLSKSQRTKLEIIECAIKMLAHEGLEAFSYPAIAEKLKVSRQLINNYFPKQEELFLDIATYIRARLQNYVLLKMKHVSRDKIFDHYILACFEWIDDHRPFTVVWLLFFYRTNHSRELRRQLTNLADIGQRRIVEMMKTRESMKRKSASFLADRAKMIQSVITGTTVMLCSEELGDQKRHLIANTLATCRHLGGFDP